MIKMDKHLFLVCVLGLAVLLSACAGMQPSPTAEEEAAVRDRAASYWDMWVKKKFVDRYTYEVPVYRQKVDLEAYIKSYANSSYSSSRVKAAVIHGKYAIVEVWLGSTYPGLSIPEVPKNDYWERIDAQWYHHFRAPKKLKAIMRENREERRRPSQGPRVQGVDNS